MGQAGKGLDAPLLNRQITGLVNHFIETDELFDTLKHDMLIFRGLRK